MLRVLGIFAAFMLAASQAPASTILITYDLTDLGSGSYRYTYSVYNNGSLGAGVAVQLFDIFFDPARYDKDSLKIVTPSPLNTLWDEAILPEAWPLPPTYDAMALAGGIPVGSWAEGFAVEFKWIGLGAPGAQHFEIYGSDFTLLQSGETATPEPALLAPLGIALAYGAWRRRRKNA